MVKLERIAFESENNKTLHWEAAIEETQHGSHRALPFLLMYP